MDVRLDGKCAVVTGGANGIGRGIANCLAASGAYVIIADIAKDDAERTAQEIRAAGGKADSLFLDVTDVDQVAQVMDKVEEMGGKLDICVHTVGVHEAKSFLEIDQKDVERLTKINVVGASNVMRASLKKMIPHRYGKLVVLTSIAARRGCTDAHYGMTKSAQMHMAWCAAMEVAKYNINVNSIAPGQVYTPMFERILDTRLGDKKDDPVERERAWQEAFSETMFKRPQTAEDIGNMAVFLCSDMAKEITGQCYNVCGGSRMN